MAHGGATLEQQFASFARYGTTDKYEKTITLTQIDRWLIQANVLDGKKVTKVDTGVLFNKFKTYKISYQNFLKFLDDLTISKNLAYDEVKKKLQFCGMPGSTPQGGEKEKEKK